ncbi:oxidoreductase [Staphylococcus shinii]|jgi:short-subunit dehydrogenase|uniref:SDR family NAD(P)-dependent oxidoreductase n=1 Tax=Staphylococcus xylosus TaxID=1288 RepID=A0A418ILK0_STAXY|nr:MULTISPECIES: oxidoreductase [Staphylococcus]MDW8543418.1 oxidoreductase [Staphylococcus sp. KG4-1]MBO3064957.1 SDR family NAD(P)-dependent oxidoreductase [Staphylococcus shinii]MDW8562842.1 oxidoreductase [Staphylococcus sp. KG4-3]MDW8569770.1 oxidoreductase [Staphylococcus shinii]MDW8574325.1 oxidoreductase [Staphylococcus shinii]
MTVALITGASSGIGFETAKMLAKKDYRVYAVSRNIKNMQALLAYNVNIIQLDITDYNAIHEVVNHILIREGHIDILINNAGYGSYGAVEDVSIEEAKRQFEVNLFGLSELTRAVIPSMREQKAGKIINISSIGGRIPNYFGTWYHASKYALEGYSESLRLELSDFGIDVIIIEPGGIKTEWGTIAAQNLKSVAKGGHYEEKALKMAQSMIKQQSLNILSHPSVVAKVIIKSIEKRHVQAKYVTGFIAKPLIILHAILPIKLFNWTLKKQISK